VVESWVRRLRMHEINTRNGLSYVSAIKVTIGVSHFGT